MLATPSVPGTYTYTWTVPTGATNPGDVNSFNPTIPGVYSVVITNTLTGCISDSASGTVIINPKPVVTVNSPTVCEGDTITLLATPSVPGTYTYTWTVPTGATNPGDVNSFTPTVSGVYSVVITNTLTGCISDSASGTVTIKPKPITSAIGF